MSNRFTGPTLTFILVFLLTGCQSVNDLQPQPDPLPTSVVEILEKEFPGYQEITVSPLEKDRVWNARLRVDTSQYDVVLNRTKILSKYQLAGNQVPVVFAKGIESLSFNGGTFSDFRRAPDYNIDFRTWDFSASYTWNNQDYLMRWQRSYYGPPSRYDIYLYPDTETVYRTTNLDDLSDSIQEIIKAKMLAVNNPQYTEDQEFRAAFVYIDKNKKKLYEAILSFSNLIVDDKGKILYYFPINLENSIPLANLPEPIRTYLQQDTEITKYSKFFSDRYAENGNEVYRIFSFQNNQSRTLYIDKNGVVLWHYYMAYPEF